MKALGKEPPVFPKGKTLDSSEALMEACVIAIHYRQALLEGASALERHTIGMSPQRDAMVLYLRNFAKKLRVSAGEER